MVRAATALFAVFLAPVAASADPPLTVLQQAGYLGRWAVSCDSPPA
jgi:hypothetical protein